MAAPVVVGMTGATGQIYGLRALELLAETDHEVHLILSDAAKINVEQETDMRLSQFEDLADEVHGNANIGAPTASGSFSTSGNAGNLITRSADVMLKERRPLVVMPREKPFNRIHLQNMLTVTDAGAIVFPPFPSFYARPDSVDEMITRTVIRALSHVTDVDFELDEWQGLGGG
jgi:4-hydroxy-3-polyprenylbenzoate decarboxylase